MCIMHMTYDKILVEQVIMGHEEIAGTILRLPVVYGPKDNQHRIFDFLKRMDDHRPVILLAEGFAKFRWTHGYVEDVAYAIALAVTNEHSARKIYNVGQLETLSMSDWIREIGNVAGWTGEIITVSASHLPAYLKYDFLNTEQHLVVDSSRIRKELGFHEVVSFEEGIRRTINWQRRNPPEKIDNHRFDYVKEDEILSKL
jgi:nucleoside-diphosphate-sugar epimerase